MSTDPDTTIIFLKDFAGDDSQEGQVAIKGRISREEVAKLQEFLKQEGPADMDNHEKTARQWLEKNGFHVIYLLYWEMVYL